MAASNVRTFNPKTTGFQIVVWLKFGEGERGGRIQRVESLEINKL
jgi:hypothetical protein